jgi:hypothetical protein
MSAIDREVFEKVALKNKLLTTTAQFHSPVLSFFPSLVFCHRISADAMPPEDAPVHEHFTIVSRR